MSQGQRGRASRALIFLIAATGVFINLGAYADIEHVTEIELASLAEDYKAGIPIAAKDLSKLSDSKWKCDMYGARSKLQVERNVSLYHFKTPTSSRISNQSAPFAGSYKINGETLTSVQAGVQDSIKWRQVGSEFITELRIAEGPENGIIAYSRCHAVM